MAKVVIVGGGIIGTACALELATAGASVALFERDELAAGASGRNQGLLSDPDDPLNGPLFEPSTEMFLEAADRAPLPVWIDRAPIGYLLVELEGDEAEPPSGSSAEEIDAAGVRALEPSIAPSVIRGWLSDVGRRLDPRAMTVGLGLLAREAGAAINHHAPVRSLRVEDDRVKGVVTDDGVTDADVVVVAAGPWSSSLLETVGVHISVTAARGWIVRVDPPEPVVHRLVERNGWRESAWRRGAAEPLDARSFVSTGAPAVGGALLNPHPDGSVLVGSSREPAVTPEPSDPEVPRRQVAEAIELIPALADATIRSAWWGIRPMSPDDRPIIGLVKDGLVVATGHGSEGVLQAGGTAKLVASIVRDEPAPFDPSAFDPARFDSARFDSARFES
jgi:D-hydroxyproline dehydrogenase subunit beta